MKSNLNLGKASVWTSNFTSSVFITQILLIIILTWVERNLPVSTPDIGVVITLGVSDVEEERVGTLPEVGTPPILRPVRPAVIILGALGWVGESPLGAGGTHGLREPPGSDSTSVSGRRGLEEFWLSPLLSCYCDIHKQELYNNHLTVQLYKRLIFTQTKDCKGDYSKTRCSTPNALYFST